MTCPQSEQIASGNCLGRLVAVKTCKTDTALGIADADSGDGYRRGEQFFHA